MAAIGEKIATREAYGNALAEFGAKYENVVVLDADLAEATKTVKFKKAFPERFFDCGIAEGNMVAIAAGIATTGKIPFCSSFAMFTAGRAFEQIRNAVGYPHLNVKIGATHAGITVGEDGATHQCLEDIGTMRTIPGMTIINPADAVEARAAVEAAINFNGPVYMRFGRLAVPVIYDEASYKLEIRHAVSRWQTAATLPSSRPVLPLQWHSRHVQRSQQRASTQLLSTSIPLSLSTASSLSQRLARPALSSPQRSITSSAVSVKLYVPPPQKHIPFPFSGSASRIASVVPVRFRRCSRCTA